MLNLKTLLANTPPEVVVRSQVCTSKLMETNTEATYIEYLHVVHCTDGARHTTIRFHADEASHLAPVWVSCTCPFWLFYCEYAVHKHHSTAIIHSNGQPAVVKNSKAHPYLCKHLVNVTKYIKHPITVHAVLDLMLRRVTHDILLVLHRAPASQADLENFLVDSTLMEEIGPALHDLVLHGYIKQRGQNYVLTKDGLAYLVEQIL